MLLLGRGVHRAEDIATSMGWDMNRCRAASRGWRSSVALFACPRVTAPLTRFYGACSLAACGACEVRCRCPVTTMPYEHNAFSRASLAVACALFLADAGFRSRCGLPGRGRLGAWLRPFDELAVKDLLALKQRPVHKGLIVVADRGEAFSAVLRTLPSSQRRLLLPRGQAPIPGWCRTVVCFRHG